LELTQSAHWYQDQDSEHVRKFSVSLALERPDKLRLAIKGLQIDELWQYMESYDFARPYVSPRHISINPPVSGQWVSSG